MGVGRRGVTHTEIGWIMFALAVVGSLLGSVPAQPVVDIVRPDPVTEPIDGVIVEQIVKPSEEPALVVVGDSGACSDGSCGVQRRGVFRGWFRR